MKKRNSLSAYISGFDVALIGFGAFAWAIVLGDGLRPWTLEWPLWRWFCFLYLLVETCWFCISKYRYAIFNRPVKRYPDGSRVDAVMMSRFHTLSDVISLDEFVQGWFLGSVTASEVPRGNIEEFVAYGFFCRALNDIDDVRRQQVADFVKEVEERWQVKFRSGYDDSLRFMAHVWEPLRVHHKPIVVYAGTELAARIAHAFLRLMGFQKKQRGSVSTWVAHFPRKPSFFFPVDAPKKTRHEQKSEVSKKLSAVMTTNEEKQWIQEPTAEDCDKELFEESDRIGQDTESVSQSSKEETTKHSSAGNNLKPSEIHIQQNAKEITHHAMEQAFDAAVAATSTAAAALSQQYPHPGQQYHIIHSNTSPTVPIMKRSSCERSPDATLDSRVNLKNTKSAENSIDLRTKNEEKVAIVFFHGVGFGVLPYLHFILDLMKACPQTPFVVLEMPHVALRLCREALEVDEVSDSAIEAIKGLGYKKACFIGHSYGTFVTSRIIQRYPQFVHSAVLLDPVCLLTCYPQLLYNFIYRPMNVSDFSSPLAIFDAARFICSRDLAISQAFCRKFHWSELMLWPDDLPNREGGTLICLSGQDDLVPSELALQQFDGEKRATIMYHPDLGHGGILMNSFWLQKIVASIRDMVLGVVPAVGLDKNLSKT